MLQPGGDAGSEYSTIDNARSAVLTAVLRAFLIAVAAVTNTLRFKRAMFAIVLLFIPLGVLVMGASQDVTAQTSTLNFQGRLLTNTGSLVPDGDYNIEFKLYDSSGSGASAQGACVGGATDDCVWVETRTGGNQVTIRDGYYSVYLGDVTSLPDIDWSQPLWLTMNIGGTGAASWDGEMSPRFRLTSVPYAFTSQQAQELIASDSGFTTDVTIDTPTSNNNITLPDDSGEVCLTSGNCAGTGGTGDILDGGQAGAISIGTTNNTTLTLLQNNSAAITLNSGQLLQFNAYNCTTFAYGGTLTTDASGNVVCADDDGGGGGSGVDTLAAIGSSPNANGATISGTTLTLQPASGSFGGVVTTGSQTFAGAKTFTSPATFQDLTISAGESLQIDSEWFSELTGSGLTNSGGALTVSVQANKGLEVDANGISLIDCGDGQILQYSTGTSSWACADSSTGSDEIITVAADDTPAAQKAAADYVADGTSDETEINNALLAATGGKVVLLEGRFVVDGIIGVPSDTTLEGQGAGTVIELDDLDSSTSVISNVGPTASGVVVRDITLNGRSDLNTGLIFQTGVSFSGVGDVSAGTPGGVIENVVAKNFRGAGIDLYESEGVIVENNTTVNNTFGVFLTDSLSNSIVGNNTSYNSSNGIELDGATNNTISSNVISYNDNGIVSGSDNNAISGNTIEANTEYGIYFDNAGESNSTVSGNSIKDNGFSGLLIDISRAITVTGNSFDGNASGLDTYASAYNTITGNIFSNGSIGGIYFESTTESVISDNTFLNNAGDNIYLYDDSDNNSIIGNVFRDSAGSGHAIMIDGANNDNTYVGDNTYLGTGAAGIVDSGTNTIYAGQVDTSGNYDIQPTGTVELLATTNVTGGFSVSGLATFNNDIRISDGSSNYATIDVQALAGNYTVSIPTITGNDTFCLQSLGNCAGAGSVTSIDVSGGSTGLSTTGGPVTSSGTITLSGTLDLDNGGTGATTATDARTNLGLGGLAVLNNVSTTEVTNGTILEADLNITNAPTGLDNYILSFNEAGGNFTWVPQTVDTNTTYNVLASQGLQLSGTNFGLIDCAANEILKRNPGDTAWICATDVDTDTNTDNQNLFSTINTTSGTNPVADNATDTLNLSAGTGITVTGSSASDTVTFASTLGTSVDLNSAEVTGTLQVANGGTGATTAAGARTNLGLEIGTDVQAYNANTTILGSTIELNSAEVSGTLGVANGGTGATSLTSNRLLIGNGTSAISVLAAGTSGQCLRSNGASAPSWQTCPTDGVGISSLGGQTGATQTFTNDTNVTISSATNVHTLGWSGQLSIARGGTGSSSAQGAINNISGLTTNGDLLYFNGTNTTRLARGTTNQCLLSTGTSIQWGACTAGGGGFTNLTLSADSGSNQTLNDTDTITIAGGDNISTVAGATDTVTINVDDGSGSGLDADLLDGQQGSYYRDADNINAGTLSVTRGGTGSGTAAGARTNLGLEIGTDVQAYNANTTVLGSSIALGAETTGNYVDNVTAGNGLSVSGSAGEGWEPQVNLSLQANKGLEADGSGLSLIDCSNGQILKYNGSNQWACAADNNTTYSVNNGSFTLQVGGTTVGNTFTANDSSNETYSIPLNTGLSYSSGISLNQATATTIGGVELGSNTAQTVAANAVTATASRTYALQLNAAGQAVVNVPWVDTDTNTTYSAGTGINLGGTTFSFDCSDVAGNQLTCSSETLEVSEGSGSGLDADLLDGNDSSYFTNASNLSSGTLADGRLSSNVALLNATQTFTGVNTFDSGVDTTTVKILRDQDSPDEPAQLLIAGDADGTDDLALEVRGNATGSSVDTSTTLTSADTTFAVFNDGTTAIGYNNLGLSYANPNSALLAVNGATDIAGALYADGAITFASLTGCDTIDTNGSGVLSCGTDANTTYSAGTGIGLSGTTFSVSAAGGLATTATGLTTTGVLQDFDTLGANTGNNEFLVSTGAGTLAWESGATARTSLGLGSLATLSSVNNSNWSGTDLSVANGGTGASTFTDYGVLYGNGISAIGATAAGTTGQCLLANTGSAPTWGGCPGDGVGVTTLAAIGSSPNANGATISGSTLNLQPANASFGGVVTTGTQTFAGEKTFNGLVNFNNGFYAEQSSSWVDVYDYLGGGGNDISLRVRSNSVAALSVDSAAGVPSFSVNGSNGDVYASGDLSASGATFSDLTNCNTIDTNGSGVLSCGTDANTTYSAGTDLDLSGTTFNIESQLDGVSTISRASSNLTLQTTGSGDILVNPAGDFNVDNDTLFVQSSTNSVGIGTATPSSRLRVEQTVTSASSTTNSSSFLIASPSSASTGFYSAFDAITSSFSGNVAGATLQGTYAGVSYSGSGTLGTAIGQENIISNLSTGTISNSYGLSVSVSANSGTMTNTYGLYVGDVTSGTQTNQAYGLYVSDADARNYFAGNVGIGRASLADARIAVEYNTASQSSGLLVQASDSPFDRGANIASDSLGNGIFGSNQGDRAAIFTTRFDLTEAYLRVNASDDIAFGTAGTDRLTIGSTGNAIFTGNVRLSTADSYLNFGGSSGASGYGIRDNGGTIEIKNSGGSWASPSISGSGSANRVTYWSGASALTSSGNFTYDGTELELSGTGGDLLRLSSTTASSRSSIDFATNGTDWQLGSNGSAHGNPNTFYLYHNSPTYKYKLTVTDTLTSIFDNFAVDTDSLYVDASANEVGVGTSNPGAKLEVRTSATADWSRTLSVLSPSVADGNQTGLILFGQSDASRQSAQLSFVDTGSDGDEYINFSINSGPANIMSLLGNGNVGIGTASPSSKLEVSGSTGDSAIRIIADTDNSGEDDNSWIFLSQDGGLVSSYLGIVGSGGDAPDSAQSYTDTLANALLIGQVGNNPLQLGANNAAYLTIDPEGEVGIGTTSPGGTSLYVVESSSSLSYTPSSEFVLQANQNTTNEANIGLISGNAADSYIKFGDAQDEQAGRLQFDHANNRMHLRIGTTAIMSLDSSYVDVNTSLIIDMNQTATTNGVCHSGSNSSGTANHRHLVTCSGTPNDYAEFYPAEQGVTAGDIVATTPNLLTYEAQGADAETGQVFSMGQKQISIIKKAATQNDNLLGIVSTAPYQTIGRDIPKSANRKPVALNGRVPVKVNNQGGAIAVGDRIALSSVAGVGKKATTAGMTVGVALEPFNGTTGQIMVYVQNYYYVPSNGGMMQGSSLSITGNVSIGGSLNVSGPTTVASLTVTGTATINNLKVTGTTEVADLKVNGKIITAGDVPTAVLGVSTTGQGSSYTIEGNDTAGTIEFETGSDTVAKPIAAGEQIEITFDEAFDQAPRVTLTPLDAASATIDYFVTRDENGFTLHFVDAPAENETYSFDYQILQ